MQEILADHPNALLCGDYNTTIQPQFDSLHAAHPESWDWLRDQVHGGDCPLLDAYRVLHPTGHGFTRYAGGCHSTAKRLDMALASMGFGAHFPLSAVSVQELDRTTDHHPVSVTFGTDCCPPTPEAPPPARCYRTLTEEEQVPFRALLSPVAEWCAEHVEAFEGIPVATVQDRTESILKAVSQSYTFVTNQHLANSRGQRDKLFEALLEAIPAPGSSDYGSRLQELESLLQSQVAEAKAKRKKKLHRALVQGIRLKRAIAEALRPTNRVLLAMQDPQTGTRTTCPRRNAEIFSDCLHNLGGPPGFLPPPKRWRQRWGTSPMPPRVLRAVPSIL